MIKEEYCSEPYTTLRAGMADEWRGATAPLASFAKEQKAHPDPSVEMFFVFLRIVINHTRRRRTVLWHWKKSAEQKGIRVLLYF